MFQGIICSYDLKFPSWFLVPDRVGLFVILFPRRRFASFFPVLLANICQMRSAIILASLEVPSEHHVYSSRDKISSSPIGATWSSIVLTQKTAPGGRHGDGPFRFR